MSDAIVVTLSAWAEESMQVETPAKAMGCIMRLSSALGYLLVRLALHGDLSDYALRCIIDACLLVVLADNIRTLLIRRGTHVRVCWFSDFV